MALAPFRLVWPALWVEASPEPTGMTPTAMAHRVTADGCGWIAPTAERVPSFSGFPWSPVAFPSTDQAAPCLLAVRRISKEDRTSRQSRGPPSRRAEPLPQHSSVPRRKGARLGPPQPAPPVPCCQCPSQQHARVARPVGAPSEAPSSAPASAEERPAIGRSSPRSAASYDRQRPPVRTLRAVTPDDVGGGTERENSWGSTLVRWS